MKLRALQLPNHGELVKLARMCWRQSRMAQAEDVARELRRMAREYQQEAARLDSGNLPDISDDSDARPFV
ncbi:MAG: hypothetical protein ACRECE_04600 [Xanthobacteraceae bacterium]